MPETEVETRIEPTPAIYVDVTLSSDGADRVPHIVPLEDFLAGNEIDRGAEAAAMRQQLADGGEVEIDLGGGQCAVLRPLSAEELAGDFVNVYHHTRQFGGPEEGGWWYDQYEPYSSHPFTPETLVQKQAEAAEENAGLRPLSSVLATYRVFVDVQKGPGRLEPATRPHYE